jgi:hypothetical protein
VQNILTNFPTKTVLYGSPLALGSFCGSFAQKERYMAIKNLKEKNSMPLYRTYTSEALQQL